MGEMERGRGGVAGAAGTAPERRVGRDLVTAATVGVKSNGWRPVVVPLLLPSKTVIQRDPSQYCSSKTF